VGVANAPKLAPWHTRVANNSGMGRSKRFLFFIEFPIFVVKIFLVIIEYQISIPLFSGCATLRIRAAEKITESIIIPVFLILCALVLKCAVSLAAHDFQALPAKFC
jgi:hypothetical protein